MIYLYNKYKIKNSKHWISNNYRYSLKLWTTYKLHLFLNCYYKCSVCILIVNSFCFLKKRQSPHKRSLYYPLHREKNVPVNPRYYSWSLSYLFHHLFPVQFRFTSILFLCTFSSFLLLCFITLFTFLYQHVCTFFPQCADFLKQRLVLVFHVFLHQVSFTCTNLISSHWVIALFFPFLLSTFTWHLTSFSFISTLPTWLVWSLFML